jgi:anti-anti-sigma factor
VLDFSPTRLLKSEHMKKTAVKVPINIDQTETKSGINLKMKGSFSGTEEAAITFFERLSKAIEKKPKEIILDMAETSMIDSMAIGLLVGLLIKSKERGITVRIDNLNSTVENVLEMTGLKKAFPELY